MASLRSCASGSSMRTVYFWVVLFLIKFFDCVDSTGIPETNKERILGAALALDRGNNSSRFRPPLRALMLLTGKSQTLKRLNDLVHKHKATTPYYERKSLNHFQKHKRPYPRKLIPIGVVYSSSSSVSPNIHTEHPSSRREKHVEAYSTSVVSRRPFQRETLPQTSTSQLLGLPKVLAKSDTLVISDADINHATKDHDDDEKNVADSQDQSNIERPKPQKFQQQFTRMPQSPQEKPYIIQQKPSHLIQSPVLPKSTDADSDGFNQQPEIKLKNDLQPNFHRSHEVSMALEALTKDQENVQKTPESRVTKDTAIFAGVTSEHEKREPTTETLTSTQRIVPTTAHHEELSTVPDDAIVKMYLKPAEMQNFGGSIVHLGNLKVVEDQVPFHFSIVEEKMSPEMTDSRTRVPTKSENKLIPPGIWIDKQDGKGMKPMNKNLHGF